MPEVETTHDVTAKTIRKICEKCGKGEMIQADMIFLTNPPKFAHRCDQCGNLGTLDKQYPRVVWELKPQELTEAGS